MGNPFKGSRIRDVLEEAAETADLLGSEYQDREEASELVFNLGLTLYLALTGRPAFAGDTSEEVQESIENRYPMPPRQWNPAITRDTEKIVLHALETDPAFRYATPQEMAADLRRVLGNEEVSAGDLGPYLRLDRRIGRKPGKRDGQEIR